MSLPISRRGLLKNVGCGFGYLALAGLAAERAAAGSRLANPLAPRTPHFAARAKRITAATPMTRATTPVIPATAPSRRTRSSAGRS
jgi:hypothetical protein